jgi:hypothetical protein
MEKMYAERSQYKKKMIESEIKLIEIEKELKRRGEL